MNFAVPYNVQVSPSGLSGCSVLLVEDEYLIAEDTTRILEDAGAKVVGPVARMDAAMALVWHAPKDIDVAVLDINLHGESSFGLADLLADHAIPYLFASGSDLAIVPPRHRDRPFIEKPIASASLVQAIRYLLIR